MFHAYKPVEIDILVHACVSHDAGLRGEWHEVHLSAALPVSPPPPTHTHGKPSVWSVCVLRCLAAGHPQPLSFANLVANRWCLTVT